MYTLAIFLEDLLAICLLSLIPPTLLLLLRIRRCYKRRPRMRSNTARLMVVLGPGGHSAELAEVIKLMDFAKYTPRCYVCNTTDELSEMRAREIEHPREPYIQRIHRARNVHQSFFSSIFSTLLSTLQCVPVVWGFQPDLVLCNGPGTCIPVCVVAFLLGCLWPFREPCRIIFLESFCRVRSLSLSGRILQWIADLFVVQWPNLATKDRKYVGRLF
ncbi:UDP-N-acetylglucosamine transferase subunit ALG14 homolog [Phlebotomus argentipes]|uniref:UDP-N-acetylglucosamine transferase subunit ALG14 homolog n=1 Tax=Phlebotomus argentipes TaxID=94469 RepID=UPI0028930A44|nr:UDP-N-acetylglucosamine transferase subunit ALG14 homolog [Phlebotomus argentipes]